MSHIAPANISQAAFRRTYTAVVNAKTGNEVADAQTAAKANNSTLMNRIRAWLSENFEIKFANDSNKDSFGTAVANHVGSLQEAHKALKASFWGNCACSEVFVLRGEDGKDHSYFLRKNMVLQGTPVELVLCEPIEGTDCYDYTMIYSFPDDSDDSDYHSYTMIYSFPDDSDALVKMEDFDKLKTSDDKLKTSDDKLKTSDDKLKTSDDKLETSVELEARAMSMFRF